MTDIGKAKSSFNWARFGQNMQKLSQTLMQGTLLMATTRSRGCHGMMGPSIWSRGCCNSGMYGQMGGFGLFNGYYSPMPSPYITDPMYMADTTNPMLIQQGMFNVEAFVDNYFTQAEKAEKLQQELNTVALAGKNFELGLHDKNQHTFVSSEWAELNEKTDKTEEEEAKLEADYNTQLSNLATSWTKFLDISFGNNDSKLTLEEFSKYIKQEFNKKNYTDEQIKKIYDFVSVQDNEDYISATDINYLLRSIDNRTGTIKKENLENIIDDAANGAIES